MKKTLQFLWLVLVTIFSAIFIIPDRFIMACVPWWDIPGWNEINEFEHERNALSKRWVIYIMLFILISSYWWVPFMYRLIASFF